MRFVSLFTVDKNDIIVVIKFVVGGSKWNSKEMEIRKCDDANCKHVNNKH